MYAAEVQTHALLHNSYRSRHCAHFHDFYNLPKARTPPPTIVQTSNKIIYRTQAQYKRETVIDVFELVAFCSQKQYCCSIPVLVDDVSYAASFIHHTRSTLIHRRWRLMLRCCFCRFAPSVANLFPEQKSKASMCREMRHAARTCAQLS